MQSEAKICQSCKTSFVIESEDFDFYKKMDVPPPTWCYLCRARRRLAYRNERALFKRKSDLSGATIFSTYPPSVAFPVYTQEEWFSDAWDATTYGKEYDFHRPFFEQFYELSRMVPKPAKSALMMIDSDYSNNADNLKNCYLVFNAAYNEDCAYGNAMTHSNHCFDNSNLHYCELCYEVFNAARSSRLFFSSGLADCTDVWFSKDMRGCSNCFGCVGLRSKSYCLWNEQLTKEEYKKRIQEYDLGSYAAVRQLIEKAEAFWLRFSNRFALHGTKSVNVIGEYLYQAKNVKYTYQNIGGEDLKYCQYVNYPPMKDCYDFSVWGEKTELCYECAMTGDEANKLKFCLQTWPDVKNLEYCEYTNSSSYCFGCVSIRKKQYCILNKQYSKEEYGELVPKIKRHMDEMPYTDRAGRVYRYGEFFPPEFSPFGYNETIADEHFPLAREEAERAGWNWRDVEMSEYRPTIAAADLPDRIDDVPDNIVEQVVGCAHAKTCRHGCTSAFRVLPEELQFYRRFHLPLPRLCVTCRHRERLKKRNGMLVYHRLCQCAGEKSENGVYMNTRTHTHGAERCPNEFETSYAPDRPEIVYCESCYNAEVA